MSLWPYPGLDSPISLQAWAHQLKVDSASDERVQQFITALRQNRWVYPETGATCQQPSFDTTNPPRSIRARSAPTRFRCRAPAGSPASTETSVPNGTVATSGSGAPGAPEPTVSTPTTQVPADRVHRRTLTP
jgi:Protein of unknown function (DUF3105)